MSLVTAAVLFDGGSDLVVDTIEQDVPGAREVLVRVEACGLCHSDLHYLDGTLVRQRPLVLGHEAIGVVEAVGDNVETVAVGDRVVTCLVAGCGSCERCQSGEPVFCSRPAITRRGAHERPRLRTRDGVTVTTMGNVGSLAEYVLLDERGVIPVGSEIPASLGAILGCAVVTGLGAVFNVANVRSTETVAVIGCGGVGLNVVQGARIAGAARVIAVDIAPSKLALAAHVGATDVVDASSTDAVEAVRALTNGGVDHAFEVIGRSATVVQALEMAAPGRAAYVVGVMADEALVPLPSLNMRRGKSLVGVFMGGGRPRVEIPRYVELWKRGLLDLDSLVSRTLPLGEVNEGFAALARGEVARSVVVF